MKIQETFEYEVDTDDINQVFTIKDYMDCVDDLPCPFYDGYKHPDSFNTKHELKIINLK